jgi:hypothetical protein
MPVPGLESIILTDFDKIGVLRPSESPIAVDGAIQNVGMAFIEGAVSDINDKAWCRGLHVDASQVHRDRAAGHEKIRAGMLVVARRKGAVLVARAKSIIVPIDGIVIDPDRRTEGQWVVERSRQFQATVSCWEKGIGRIGVIWSPQYHVLDDGAPGCAGARGGPNSESCIRTSADNLAVPRESSSKFYSDDGPSRCEPSPTEEFERDGSRSATGARDRGIATYNLTERHSFLKWHLALFDE